MVIVLLVEDSYGQEFYKHVLRDKKSNKKMIIRRLAGARCNPKIERQIKAFCTRYKVDKIAIVVDSEYEKYDIVYDNLMKHIKNIKNRNENIEIFIINPSHEKLLCLGLGGSSNVCSCDPISYIERKIQGKYEHKMLGQIVVKASVNLMLNDQEFKRLLSFIYDP